MLDIHARPGPGQCKQAYCPPVRALPRALALVGAALLAQACGDDAEIVDAGTQSPDGGGGTGAQLPAPEEWSAPALRGPVTLPDDDLAHEALTLLGSSAVGAQGSCSNCHALGRPTLTHWGQLTREFSDACLAETDLPDTAAVDAMLACFRSHAEPSPAFAPAQFGIYAAAAHLPWFSFVFEHATEDAGDWRARHDAFITSVGMPRAGSPLTQAQFDLVAEWFARGLPELFDLVPEDAGEDCTPGLDPRLRAHVEEMAQRGWQAQNEQVPLLMFGCAEGQSGADCLGDLPLARQQPFGVNWDGQGDARIRILHDNTATRSIYWARTSPDGRFIASGLLDGEATGHLGQFVDLENDRVISADFSYDPTFFPDGSGFLVQRGGNSSSAAPGGGPTNGSADPGDVALVCNQSVLSDDPDVITGDEDGCISLDSQIGLYQQLATSIDGQDYWVVFGSYTGDNGGLEPVLGNPSAAFETQTLTTLTPMINRGGSFEAGEPTRVQTPLQGDPMLSPSGELMVTRLKGRERAAVVNGLDIVTADQSGYALHLLTTTQQGDGWTASLADVGRVCLQGGKAVVSYDERWMVLHHYVTASDAVALGFDGPDDPDFEDYLSQGASNVYLVDLLDGSSHLITHMDAGQYALYPHFRSDGWIYFVVRTLGGAEYFAASDAALLLAGANP
jgi:hypothetical protein